MHRIILVAGLLLATIGATAAQDEWAQVEGTVVPVVVRAPLFEPTESSGGRIVWQHEFTQWPGSHALRLHFATVVAPAESASSVELLIQDRSGVVVERHRGAEIAQLSGRWSLVVPGDYALVSLVAAEQPVGVEVVIDAVARTTTSGVRLSIIGPSELQPISAYGHDPFIGSLARAVAKLAFVANGQTYVCSGFMIGTDLLMTNEHCVNLQQTCLTTVAIFGYQAVPGGFVDRGSQYRCVELVTADYELDVALLRLERDPGGVWGMLEVSETDATTNDAVMIIQHPGGRPKEISLIECAVSNAVAEGRGRETDVAHRCDTEGGSSGSPIVDTRGRVVGLHHYGVGTGDFSNQNRGVRMSRIVRSVLPRLNTR